LPPPRFCLHRIDDRSACHDLGRAGIQSLQQLRDADNDLPRVLDLP
jgi:hypothetical protein